VYENAYSANGRKTDFHFRVGFASACLVSMPHAFASAGGKEEFDPANVMPVTQEHHKMFGVFDWDEYHAGDLNDWHWLGKPLAVAKQDVSDMNGADLLAKVDWQWSIAKKFKAEYKKIGNSFSANVQYIPASTLPNNMWAAVSLSPAGSKLPQLMVGKEYTLEFEARGDDVWQYQGQVFDKVPRMITLQGAITTKGERPMSVLVDSQWRSYKISFIADSSSAVTPVFGVSEQIGTTEIRNIKLHTGGAERWSREFEKGLVLLNMTNDPWTVPLNGKYKYIKGKQDPAINSGKELEDEVVVPSRDAVFLIKL
jgi:hypothetical protein